LVVRTYQQKTAETEHRWYVVDASGQRLGTLAVRVARALSGKHKPTWTPHIDDGDHVIVLNAEKIELGGPCVECSRAIACATCSCAA
jgi:large subunit ribosomal protein L13